MTRSKLEAVTLDLGHTLLFEVPSRAAIYGEAARARGCRVSDDQMASAMKRAFQELPLEIEGCFRFGDRWFEAFIERIFHQELELSAPETQAVALELFARFENPATFRMYPGALELLRTVRALGLRLGLVSNWSARLPRLLHALDLTHHFDFVLCSALEGVEKPDAQLFARAAELAQADPTACLHAGDHALKDGGALAVGMQFCLVHARPNAPAPPAAERAADLPALQQLIEERAA